MSAPDLLLALLPVVEALEKLGIPYYIGGSVASSIYGVARSTLDVDIVADMQAEHVPSLVDALQDDYYIDRVMVEEAVRRRSSFNVIHLATMLKVDVFVLKSQPYARQVLQHIRRETLIEEEAPCSFCLASPEDVILNKLDWFRQGGGVSERQWHDVLGVLKVQARALDGAYLRHWADQLGLGELLLRALRESGIEAL